MPSTFTQIKCQLLAQISSVKRFNPEENILIFGEPRSGSTWLAELISMLPNRAIINEPLHLGNNNKLRDLKFSWRQHIPMDRNWLDAEIAMKEIFTGKELPAIMYFKNSLAQMISAKKLVYKIVRGKLLLPWLLSNFKFRFKPIVLIRHPLAIMHSLSQHSAWKYEYQKFVIPDAPFTEIYEPHISFLQNLKSNEGQIIALWALANNYLQRMDSSDYHWIYYEDLVSAPKEVLHDLGKDWKLDLDHLVKYINIPSGSSGKSTIMTDTQLYDWTEKLDPRLRKEGEQIMDYFEIDIYSKEDVFPKK